LRLDTVTRIILDHILQKNDFDIPKFSQNEKFKCQLILQSINYSLDGFFNETEFSENEKGRIVYTLLKQGKDASLILEKLDWQGFEHIISVILDEKNYSVLTNFRFKDEFTKYEIDLLAFKFPYLFAIDCKRHSTGSSSFLKSSAEKQKERVEILFEQIPIISEYLISNLNLPIKRKIFLYPMIVSWKSYNLKFYSDIPIVSYDNLSGFLQEIDEYRDAMFNLSLTFE
jgi:hypothetical protein